MYSLWTNAEQFYTTIFPVILIVLLVLFIVYFIALLYTEKGATFRKISNRGFLSVVLFSLVYLIWGHTTYGFWVEQNQFINPGIREYNKILGSERYYEPETIEFYRNSYSLLENLSELELYEREKISDPFPYNYIGSRSNIHYFAFGEQDQYAFNIYENVNWGTEEQGLNGWLFHLKDSRFESLGFHNNFKILFDSISIPIEEQKELDSIDEQNVFPVEDIFIQWIFDVHTY